jgi:hypothetical protein
MAVLRITTDICATPSSVCLSLFQALAAEESGSLPGGAFSLAPETRAQTVKAERAEPPERVTAGCLHFTFKISILNTF